jgi:hypothetical protein
MRGGKKMSERVKKKTRSKLFHFDLNDYFAEIKLLFLTFDKKINSLYRDDKHMLWMIGLESPHEAIFVPLMGGFYTRR